MTKLKGKKSQLQKLQELEKANEPSYKELID